MFLTVATLYLLAYEQTEPLQVRTEGHSSANVYA